LRRDLRRRPHGDPVAGRGRHYRRRDLELAVPARSRPDRVHRRHRESDADRGAGVRARSRGRTRWRRDDLAPPEVGPRLRRLGGAFSASAVEMVEALTIVLGVGVVRGWRSTLIGVGIATIVLAALVAALGPALTYVPISTLRLVVGALLLAFGMQWLRKAILRSSGHKAMHDEDEAFRRERAEAAAAGREEKAGLDWYAFT